MAKDLTGAQRRSRRKAGSKRKRAPLTVGSWTVELLPGPPVGPDVVTPSPEEVLDAIDGLPPDFDWAVLAEHIVPIFPRVRSHPINAPDPLHVFVPPGVTIGFGIDLGTAFVTITPSVMATWRLTAADILATSLSNLKRRAALVSPHDVVRSQFDGAPVQLLQSRTSSGSAFVLLPEELDRLFGPAPKLLVAPMRDLLVSLPIDADRLLAAELFDLFASQDPNCLAPLAFLQRAGRVTVDGLVPGLEALPQASARSPSFH